MALARFCEGLQYGEAALLFSRVSRRYLTRFSSSDGILLATREGGRLYLDPRYFEMAQLQQKKGLLPQSLTLCAGGFDQDLTAMIEQGAYGEILFEDYHLTVAALSSLKKRFPKVDFSPMGRRVEEMRLVKTEEEIKKIAESQRLSEAAFSYILPRLTTERRESEIAAELEYFMKKNGATESGFDTICVSGTRTSLPHGTPTDSLLQNNAFVTMDFGCILDGYASDMTRTVCLGKATEEMRTVYQTVLSAQLAGLSAVRAGVQGKAVDKAARDVIVSAGFGEYFGHATGHGIGLEIHELPSFSPKYEETIPERAVLSVEPGIYLPGKFGVRIEDLVVVRTTYGENLNSSSKELLEL